MPVVDLGGVVVGPALGNEIRIVAEGRNGIDWISAMLANKERVPDSLVFVARGLTLHHVDYDGGIEVK